MDETEDVRRGMVADMNATPLERAELEVLHGPVWDTEQLRRDFKVDGFLAPFVSVTRKEDGKKGTLTFQHQPRYYFGWEEDKR